MHFVRLNRRIDETHGIFVGAALSFDEPLSYSARHPRNPPSETRMMKIALLGAGHIGQTIARLLHATGDYQVTVLDKSAAYLKVLSGEGIATLRWTARTRSR
jgi:lactate dehydrogenase-like 2-hydroxyacid dehydrogenase